MKNNIPTILSERDLSIAGLHRMIIHKDENLSYVALHKLASPGAGKIADGVQIGTLRKIAEALGVEIADTCIYSCLNDGLLEANLSVSPTLHFSITYLRMTMVAHV